MNAEIKNPQGEKLDYTFAGGDGGNGWLVILGHGVTGNSDRPVIVDTANALNAAGFDTLRFSFAGNGASGGDFRDSTITKETADLKAVLDAVAGDYARIAYVGHSMGAAVGVLVAAEDSRIHALISLAGMVDTKKFAETEFGSETPDQGVMWDDADCPLSSAFMKDLCETVRTVLPQAEQVKVPWLLVHGIADDVVLVEDTRAISELKGSAVTTKYIEEADHSFNEPGHKAAMTTEVVKWMRTLV